MATNFHLPLTILQQHLNNGMYLTEALMVPSFTRITATSRAGIASIEKMVRSYVRDLPRGELRTLMLPKSTHSYYVKVRQQPPKRDDSWQEPVDLRFSITTWEYNDELIFVRVPALELELSTTKDGKWKQVIQKEIQNQLQRLQHSANLRNLSQIQISNKYRTFKRKLEFLLPDLKSIAQQEFAKENQVEKKTTLKQVATELTPKLLDSSYEQENYLKILEDLFRQKAPQGVLLIGPSGVGKTALFRQLVKQSKEYQLDEFQFYSTSGSRIVAGQTGFGMWQDRCTKLIRELAQEKSIIHLGNLAELIDVGKSEHNQLGIATFLRPAIARGEILCVAECTPEQVPMIEREDPQLMEAFIAVRLEEPDNKRSMSILSAVAAKHPQVKRAIAPPALERLERLHRRYATYSASPGRPLQFLLRLNIGDKITPIDEQEVLQQFARETGLPAVLLDPEQRLDVPRMKQWFCERVIGQQEAVDIVADLITTVKTDLMRPERPIASLIFIGPTGVGKTEMAKALAEFLYGSRDRLTRFDMSEYSDVISARRLVGTAYGVEGLLTAKVREQPFSVILFDEFEKAHESCFDFFLQMFGEARLTDAGGRLADFRNCVLILTSNLGAESFQAGAAGFRPAGDRATHAHEHFTRALERFLRPELMNRIDRVVPFGTLSPEMIRNIARREWQKVRERDGLQFRQVELSYSDEVLNRISEQGFDARYGARPLKRSMEREMLAPIAHQLNMHLPHVPLKAEIQYGDTGITTKVSINHAHQVNDAVLQNRKSFLRRMVSLRQRLQQLQKGTACQDLHNEQFQLERIETHIQKNYRKQPIH
ncbi:MAG: AAA family ATPase [Zavarzinella sp.]